MVKILVADKDDILSIDSTKFRYPGLESDIFKKDIKEEVEEEFMPEEEPDVQTYRFHKGEISCVSDGPRARVLVEKSYIDMRLKYVLDLKNYLNDRFDVLVGMPDSRYDIQEAERLRILKARDIFVEFNRGLSGFNLKSRHGVTMASTFGDLEDTNTYGSGEIFLRTSEPGTLRGIGTIDLENPSLNRYGIRAMSKRNSPFNNVYPDKRICWGGTSYPKALQNSSDVVSASSNLLNVFLSSDFNRDLSNTLNIKTKHLLMAIKRAYNRPKNNIQQKDFDFVRSVLIERIEDYHSINGDISMGNLIVLGVCSFFNIDLTDLYI